MAANVAGELVLELIWPVLELVVPQALNIFEGFVALVAGMGSVLLVNYHVLAQVLWVVGLAAYRTPANKTALDGSCIAT
jgi:hypothetical protein